MVVGHDDASLKAVLVEALDGLLDQGAAICQERTTLAVCCGGSKHRGRQLSLAEAAAGRHHHALVACAESRRHRGNDFVLLWSKLKVHLTTPEVHSWNERPR